MYRFISLVKFTFRENRPGGVVEIQLKEWEKTSKRPAKASTQKSEGKYMLMEENKPPLDRSEISKSPIVIKTRRCLSDAANYKQKDGGALYKYTFFKSTSLSLSYSLSLFYSLSLSYYVSFTLKDVHIERNKPIVH